jgi:hypothetical protein
MVQRRLSGSGQRVIYERCLQQIEVQLNSLVIIRIAICIMFELIFLLYLQVSTYRIRTHHITSERWMVETIDPPMFIN